MESYPKLMEQMRDIMEEWKDEREQLLTTAEQTHAYCQSLAFQVGALSHASCRIHEHGRGSPTRHVVRAAAVTFSSPPCAVASRGRKVLLMSRALIQIPNGGFWKPHSTVK